MLVRHRATREQSRNVDLFRFVDIMVLMVVMVGQSAEGVKTLFVRADAVQKGQVAGRVKPVQLTPSSRSAASHY